MTSTLVFTPLTYEEWLAEAGRAPKEQARHLPGKHNQKTHGKNYGDTVHPVTGRRPTAGYQVGQPTGSMIVPRAEWKSDDGKEATRQFLLKNKAIFDSEPDAYMGVWLDKAKQEIDLDVSHNVLDLDTAMEMARQWDQQAIWDNVNARAISVGGTGAREYAESRHQTPEGLLDHVQGGAARVDRGAPERGRPGRGLRLDDPEVAEALERWRHHGPGPHKNGTPQSVHSGGAQPAAALAKAEAAGLRETHPITSVAQLDPDQQASFGEVWQPYTRRHDDGTTTEIQVDRAELKRHIAHTIKGATPEQMELGKRWYADAHDYGMELATKYGVEPRVAFGVLAALSPNTAWGANKTKADKALRQFKSGKFDHMDDATAAVAMKLAFGKDALQAVQIMRNPAGAFGSGLPTGLKRQSFVNNMMHPDNGFDVTVDGWVAGALQRSSHGLNEADALAWIGRSTNQAKTTGLVVKHKGYIAVADVVREVAADAGLSPQQAQAVYWVASGGGTGASMWETES